tara:strand:+ start:1424 stop:2134 length:711 start_codon:yes stop_codon:yes gene_type:complete
MINRLILGDGWLGAELVKKTNWDYISRKKNGIDFTDINSYKDYLVGYDEIINCIAYTNTYDKNKEPNWDINYKGVVDLVDFIINKDIKLIHYSTDYVYANSESNVSEHGIPVHCENWYSYTKLLGESYVELKLKNYLVIRGTHKPTPFMFEEAYINQIGNFDYIDNISKIHIDLIEGDARGIYNVGTELKTMYDLAKKTKPNVIPVNKKFHHTMPNDITMNLDKLNSKLKEINDKK